MLDLLKIITLRQRSPNCFVRGHINYYTTVRGPNILGDVKVSGYVTFYQINKYFVDVVVFRYWQIILAAGNHGFAGRMEWLRAPDAMVSRARLGPRAVVCSMENHLLRYVSLWKSKQKQQDNNQTEEETS